MSEAMRRVGGDCCLMLLKCFPLQFEDFTWREDGAPDLQNDMNFYAMEQDTRKADATLRSYYESWGFRSLSMYPSIMYKVQD